MHHIVKSFRNVHSHYRSELLELLAPLFFNASSATFMWTTNIGTLCFNLGEDFFAQSGELLLAAHVIVLVEVAETHVDFWGSFCCGQLGAAPPRCT